MEVNAKEHKLKTRLDGGKERKFAFIPSMKLFPLWILIKKKSTWSKSILRRKH